jgi:hypothetical protein
MDKIEEKMARFTELSRKFSKKEEDIVEIAELKDIMEDIPYIGSVHLTQTTATFGYTTPQEEEKKENLTLFERVEKGVARRLDTWKEYNEYMELQKTLGDYFKAKAKL